jgi:ribonuclease-3
MKIEIQEFNDRVESLENILDYQFKDKSLLLAAITHRSFVAEYPKKLRDYEVLEFLGDSVVSLIVSEILIKQFPDAREGDLSQLRSAIVSEAYLSKLAKSLKVSDFVLISRGEKSQKGEERDSLLCDVFEAIFGALYVDADYKIDVPREIFNKLFKDRVLEDIKTENIPRDYKSLLQMETQRLYGKIPTYKLIHSEGPEHDKVFVVECEIEQIKTTGKGKSKKEAETAAAKEAFKKIKE